MRTLFDVEDRLLVTERLDRLALHSAPRWGQMDCAQMLAHLADGLRMAIGELPTRPKRGPLRFGPLRHAVIYWLPFPKDAPTAPELITRRAVDCPTEMRELKRLILRFVSRAGASEWPEHPAFGQLSEQDWGVLAYKHIDHHLRQFGV